MAERTSLKQIRDAGKRKKAGTDIGVIGALADPQFREDVLRGLGETSARGVAGVLGAPVDLTTMAMRPFGYSVPAEQVVGGSDYIGRQMERAGLISGERRPIAEMLGGIMTPDPLDVAKLGAMAVPVVGKAVAGKASKAENVAQGLYHPIGEGKKLNKPIREMLFTQETIKDLPARQIISPEQLLGATFIPATGDRTAAGKMLTEVEGVKLSNPVMLEGGPDFMRTHSPYGSAWASDKGPITTLSKRIQEAAGQGSGDVYMVYTPMSHVGGDFSTMMSDALLEQIKGGKITKKMKKDFDQEVRKVRPEWKGVDDPSSRDQLNANGALRHAFIDRMRLDKFANAGFPDLPTTRAAILEPDLMEVPIHAGGFAVAKMDPSGKVISDSPVPHTTYNTQLAGQYLGGFERPIPRELLFSDFTQARRNIGTDPRGDVRSFQLANPIQKASPQWLDNIMRYMESSRNMP